MASRLKTVSVEKKGHTAPHRATQGSTRFGQAAEGVKGTYEEELLLQCAWEGNGESGKTGLDWLV